MGGFLGGPEALRVLRRVKPSSLLGHRSLPDPAPSPSSGSLPASTPSLLRAPHLPSVSPPGAPGVGTLAERPPHTGSPGCCVPGEGAAPGGAGRGQCCAVHGAWPAPSASPVVGRVGLLRVRRFPDGSAGKESARSAGDLDSIPGLGRSPGKGNGSPLQYSGLEHPMDSSRGRRVRHD